MTEANIRQFIKLLKCEFKVVVVILIGIVTGYNYEMFDFGFSPTTIAVC